MHRWSHLSFNLPLQRDHPVSIISRTERTVHCHWYAHSHTLTALLLAHWHWPGVCHTAAAGAAHVIGGASTNSTALRCVTHQQLISCLLLLLPLLLTAAGSSCHRDLTSLFAALVCNWFDFFWEKSVTLEIRCISIQIYIEEKLTYCRRLSGQPLKIWFLHNLLCFSWWRLLITKRLQLYVMQMHSLWPLQIPF